MLTETELKERLQQLAANKFKPSTGDDLASLTLEMMRHIGSTDPVLRDDLIYSGLATWMVEGLLEPEQMMQLMDLAVDENHLFFKIGEQDTDSVFMRSFSALLLPVFLYVHRKRPYLAPESIQSLKQTIFHYLEEENDKRGFIRGKGWAHAVAHAADALGHLASCEAMGAVELQQILAVIREQMSIAEFVFAHAEDERMAAVVAVLKREVLAQTEIAEWLKTFPPLVEPFAAMPEDYYRYLNVKQFLRSLYFRADTAGLHDEVQKAVRETAVEIIKF